MVPGNASMSSKLDREVLATVQSLIEDSYDSGHKYTALSLYEQISSSNSHLSRQKKRIILPSIERSLDALLQNQSQDGRAEEMGLTFGNAINEQILQDVEILDNTLKPTAIHDSSKRKRDASGELPRRKKKAVSSTDRSHPTDVDLRDLGGIDEIVKDFYDFFAEPLHVPERLQAYGIEPTKGFLFHGPPGCGKTTLAHAIAAEFKVPFISISAPSIVSGTSGESEKALRDYFDEAKKIAPCIIFIDEIDAITQKRENAQREMEKRIVAQLGTCMDELSLKNSNGKAVFVIAATNRPDSLDSALRRNGRFQKEILLPVPNEEARMHILETLTRNILKDDDIKYKELARATSGFVGADLKELVSLANRNTMTREFAAISARSSTATAHTEPLVERSYDSNHRRWNALSEFFKSPEGESLKHTRLGLSNADLAAAVHQVQPSATREGFAAIPKTTWADVGALGKFKEELRQAIVQPIQNPEGYRKVGLTAPSGVLLYGPPGCGKTLMAKAAINEAQANFISVKGPELLNKFVGESERAVRQVFARARSCAPCVIFFDEMDALAPVRSGTSSEAKAGVVNTLLTELDGASSREGVFVIGTTNRHDMIDPALLRPGRLSRRLYVGLPTEEGRSDILLTLAKGTGFERSGILADIARGCNAFSGADLAELVNQAKLHALKRDNGESGVILEDFRFAQNEVKPSVQDAEQYKAEADLTQSCVS